MLAAIAIFHSTQTVTTTMTFGGENVDAPSAYKKKSSKTTTTKLKTASTTIATRKRLPTLEELTSITGNYDCPKGYKVFQNIILPRNVTHANRKIPKVIHVTAKSRCVTSKIKKHILEWKFPDHSLYFHDDAAVFKLLDYSTNDRYGNEVVQNLTKAAMCITSGATLSDIWRYILLYHYGGIYTDIDNAPGVEYSAELIQPDTDSFFFIEAIGTLSQYYMASSKHHPLLLHVLRSVVMGLYKATNSVMINKPAKTTGPRALKNGMVAFRHAINATSDGYEPEGTYDGALGYELESTLSWYNNNNEFDGNSMSITGEAFDYKEYPSPSEFLNRTVTIVGKKGGEQSKRYVSRSGMGNREKSQTWKAMNMTHYHGSVKRFPKTNKISCQQHASRMITLINTTTSIYYNKLGIADLAANYEFRKNENYYFDVNTNEKVIPWKDDKKDDKEKKKKKKKKPDRQAESDKKLGSLMSKYEQQQREQHENSETSPSTTNAAISVRNRSTTVDAVHNTNETNVDQEHKDSHDDHLEDDDPNINNNAIIMKEKNTSIDWIVGKAASGAGPIDDKDSAIIVEENSTAVD